MGGILVSRCPLWRRVLLVAKLTKRTGTMYFFASFSLLLASPLGGQMLQTFGPQALACLYVGLVMTGGICFLLARQILHGTTRFVIRAKI
jgi:hypothetical protein